jgi:hypothetical protein
LKKNERWFTQNQIIEAVDEIHYLGVTLKCKGGWNKHKTKIMVKINETLVATEKCLKRTPDMKAKNIENVDGMICEWNGSTGIEERVEGN